jgi:tetratricopeptide (TPR) repeat protein
MTTNADAIIKDLFQKNSLNEVTQEELHKFHLDYPFSSIGSFFYAKKLKQQNTFQFEKIASHTSLYFNSQPWLYYLLNEVGTIDFAEGLKLPFVETIIEHVPRIEQNLLQADIKNDQSILPSVEEKTQNLSSVSAIKDEDLLELSYKQYHTVDYFASQGIKLGQIDSSDKLGQKVKTFTEWLKTMKNIQKEEADNVSQKLQQIGENTLVTSDTQKNESIVLTETMAEIYQKQGLTDKAIEVYDKLSLQNPDNSHIFAVRIKALKDKRP